MPTVRLRDGSIRRFPYTKAGRAAAQKAVRAGGELEESREGYPPQTYGDIKESYFSGRPRQDFPAVRRDQPQRSRRLEEGFAFENPRTGRHEVRGREEGPQTRYWHDQGPSRDRPEPYHPMDHGEYQNLRRGTRRHPNVEAEDTTQWTRERKERARRKREAAKKAKKTSGLPAGIQRLANRVVRGLTGSPSVLAKDMRKLLG